VELARRLLSDAARGKIVILSDGCFEGAAAVREKDLRVPDGLDMEPAALVTGRRGLAIWPFLVGVGVVLLAMEWCCYQRRWTN